MDRSDRSRSRPPRSSGTHRGRNDLPENGHFGDAVWRVVSVGALALFLVVPPLGALARAGETRANRAQALYRHALRLLEDDSIESRRRARAELIQATLLRPDEPKYHVALGRVYIAGGFLREARKSFERALEIDPDQDEAHWGLGTVCRYDWLKTADEHSLDRAIQDYSIAARIAPTLRERWIRLAPLLVERGNLRAAQAAAERAFEAEPQDPVGLLSVAYTSYLSGNLERADIGFQSAVPRLEPRVRRLFEDVRPIMTPQEMRRLDHLDEKRRAAALSAFWKDIDPDLSTRMNEARLEYWARAAHAYFLYFDSKRQAWDMRGQLYVRYGAPRWRDFNPLGSPKSDNWQVWRYPELGMRIWLQDPARDGRYQWPGKSLAFYSVDQPAPILPYPDSLAHHPELLATGRACGVFHRMPPGAVALDVRAVVSQFVGGRGPHLLAQAEAPGPPGNSLTAEWVVLDSTWGEVARSLQVMTASACDSTELRVADFATDLSPGDYRIGLSVRGEQGARGVFRTHAKVLAAKPGLGLSDIVVTCGPPLRPARGEEPTVRLAPNPEGRVRRGGSLVAYFEIYGLDTTLDGTSRFEYTATVRSADKDNRFWFSRLISPRAQIPAVVASREEENVGVLRRQFFSVPVQSLPPGRYSLEIRVKDLIGSVEAAHTAAFVIP
jgi:GWxTD domain-containing protein